MKPESRPSSQQPSLGDALFLPDFCNIRVIFLVVLIAELLAFVLALAPQVSSNNLWERLGIISMFVQWVTLVNAALLCGLRPLFKKQTHTMVATTSFLIILVVTALLTEVTMRLALFVGLESVLPSASHADFLFHNVAIGAIVSAIALRYFYMQHQLTRRIKAASHARFEALQARIRPHFLFNCMNTIASLTRTQPALAEEVTEDLADLFRMSLADVGNQISLNDELALCRRYLNIEKLRLGDRLNIIWKIDELPDTATLPSLTLQPLLENAVYHGIEPRQQPGTIEISGKHVGDAVEFMISNPAAQSRSSRRDGNHMALDNIRERLKATYGEEASLTSETVDGRYYVAIRLPVSGTTP
ncbi:MAG: sensor histidine kinase [Thiotrichaceae bacterium]|nr:sensor histidine kinase [Thiotrichaceae bacterium]PCI12808.1 MAG: histidine kinase [Thiotrichales bacterium]